MAPHAKELVVEFTRRIYERKYASSTGGNISIRDKESIYITPAGMPKYKLSSLDVLKVSTEDPNSRTLAKASREFPMHFAIYKAYPKVNAVIHAHPQYSVALSCLPPKNGSAIPALTPSFAVKIKKLNLVDFFLPGSAELSDAVVKAVKSNYACLMRNHGTVTMGADIFGAYELLEEIEDTAKAFVLSGFKAEALDKRTIAELTALYGSGVMNKCG